MKADAENKIEKSSAHSFDLTRFVPSFVQAYLCSTDVSKRKQQQQQSISGIYFKIIHLGPMWSVGFRASYQDNPRSLIVCQESECAIHYLCLHPFLLPLQQQFCSAILLPSNAFLERHTHTHKLTSWWFQPNRKKTSSKWASSHHLLRCCKGAMMSSLAVNARPKDFEFRHVSHVHSCHGHKKPGE